MAEIIITIPDDKVQQLRDAIWVKYPPPEDWVGSDLDWVKEWLTRFLKRIYHKGIQKDFDSDIGIS